jgi:C-terminal processing protease CtpA/Prc
MFNEGPAHLVLKGTKITLGIKTEKGIKKVNIYTGKGLRDTVSLKKEDWRIPNLANSYKNYFVIDTVNSFAYIRLTACNKEFQDFFAKKYPLISTVNNLIIDISKNTGGSNNFSHFALTSLVNQDTIYSITLQGKVHNAFAKGYIAHVLRTIPDFNMEKYSSDQIPAIKYYKGNAFEDIRHFINYKDYKNPVEPQNRYKGNIYIIIGQNTVSAGEGFAIELSQSKNTVLLGSKTAGALGNIYPIHLPSGFVIIMNVVKTYDYQGNDISSGISPDYEYDFSELYQTEDTNEVLNKFIKIIQELEETR